MCEDSAPAFSERTLLGRPSPGFPQRSIRQVLGAGTFEGGLVHRERELGSRTDRLRAVATLHDGQAYRLSGGVHSGGIEK